MHELPVTESILEITLRYANTSSASRVTNLYIVIGQLASIIDDSVQFYWDIVSRGTLAEGALLHFKRIPAELECLDCHTRFGTDQPGYSCPSCASNSIKIVAGNEFFLEAIDIDS